MTPVDPRKLLYFVAIVEYGSLSAAARNLGLSQPALSSAMDRLETSLGIQLLERSHLGISPTAKGEILYGHARMIREEINQAWRNLTNVNHDNHHMLRIGCLPSLSGMVLPRAIGRWRLQYAQTAIQVIECAQFDLLSGLVRRDHDMIIGFTEVFDMEEGLRQQVLFRDQLCVIARPGHPLLSRSDLEWHDLMSCPWITPTARRSHTVLEQVMAMLQLGPPSQITICGSVALLKSLVRESDHLALMPEHAVRAELSEGQLRALPFTHPILQRDIAVFYREGSSIDAVQRSLVNCVREVGQELCRPAEVMAAV